MRRFGAFTALDDISFEVPSGSLTALVGPSGSGKSTILRIIAGLEPPDRGSVLLNGVDVTRAAPQDRGIGFVFQHYAMFPYMTVRDNVAFGLSVRRRPNSEIRKRVDDLLELVELDCLGNRYPSQLSGVSSSAWRWPAPSRWNRRSYCWTSHSAHSTHASDRNFGPGCASFTTSCV
jgi:sulfate transport system ATP-binding protein